MEKRDILLQIIQHYTNGNKSQFAKILGVPAQNISAWVTRNSFDVDIISTKCIDINPAFVLTGEGPITLDAGVPTPTVSPSAPVHALNNANLDQRINELLTVCHTLTDLMAEAQKSVAEGQAILRKSQQQFDELIDMYKHSSYPSYMAAENDPSEHNKND